MLVYVVRHGESEDDSSDSYGGAADFRLTDRGRAQIAQVVGDLKEFGLQAVYSSPLARARESAEIIGRELHLPVTVVFDLRERNTYGVLSGHTRSQARELFGYLLDRLDFVPGEGRDCVPGGEEYGPFVERVRGAFQAVIDSAADSGFSTVAVVTHGKFTKALFTEVLQNGADYSEGHASINSVNSAAPPLGSS
ncbi:histidine phosphatase family protein [Micromonospora sp. NPDC050784]|uniref:histidine phosphatase family protein n=1 Tax=Micromonospora sp. NPDC050784 TaxID=3364281 RepID=UPI003799CDE1